MQPGYLASGQPLKNIAEAAALWVRCGRLCLPRTCRCVGARANRRVAYLRQAGRRRGDERSQYRCLERLSGAGRRSRAHRKPYRKRSTKSLPASRSTSRRSSPPSSRRSPATSWPASRASGRFPAGVRRADHPPHVRGGRRLTATASAELGTELEGLPAGDISAADRLNRLQAVNAQLENASPEMRRALLQRRDQILVDTTPEALQAAAEPMARRQAIGAQQGRITGRLEEIAAERRQIDAQKSSVAAGGQYRADQRRCARHRSRLSARTLCGADANRGAVAIAARRSPKKAPQLPFEQTAAEGQAEVAKGALVSGVQQIARRAGYNMPAEEAGQISAKLFEAIAR